MAGRRRPTSAPTEDRRRPPAGGGQGASRGGQGRADPVGGLPDRRCRHDEQRQHEQHQQDEPRAPHTQTGAQRDADPCPGQSARSPQGRDLTVPVSGPFELVHEPGGGDQQGGAAACHPGGRGCPPGLTVAPGRGPPRSGPVAPADQHPSDIGDHGWHEDADPPQAVGGAVVDRPPDRPGQVAVDPEGAQHGQDQDGKPPDVL